MPYIGSKMFYAHDQKLVFSEHAQDILLFHAHAYCGEGLSMPTDGCSVCMPIIIINSKLRGG